ncbi:MAG: hypothetical protein CM15mP21_0490 [Hyphomicrobiales bacterium]|nr:MAG: hypothetical protein CM15mP21_0490 [Hyphomicrobiales bacterium]
MTTQDQINTHTISVLVDTRLACWRALSACFRGAANIDSLTVAEVDDGAHTSRITVVTTGTPW